ncbi:MAG TPA: zinc-binding dehydrogenase [Thermomicrobiales bacterium]
MKTRAIVIAEPFKVQLREVELPAPQPHEVVVRTLFSGISVGTERHYITGVYADMGQDVAANYPFVTGYQRSGVVESVGGAVDDLAVGDLVIMGRSRLADPRLKGGAGHVGIGVFDAKQVYRLPAGADPEAAALWVMAGVGLHGARMTAVRAGEVVAVIGLGMIGQMAAQAARLRGARVIASDRDARRVEIGRHSADEVFQGTAEEFADHVLATHPAGVDVVADTGAKVEVWETCQRLARREGRVNLQGYYPGSFRIDSYNAHVRRMQIFCPSGYDDPNEIAAAIPRFSIQPLITHRFTAGEAESAYDLVIRAPKEIVGGIIDWRTEA